MICDFFCKDNLQRIFILELTNLYLILYLPQVLKQSLDVIKCHQIIYFVFQALFFFRKILLFLSQMYAFIICHKAVVLNEPRECEGPLVVRLLCVCVGASTWGSISPKASACLCLAFQSLGAPPVRLTCRHPLMAVRSQSTPLLQCEFTAFSWDRKFLQLMLKNLP